MGRPEHYPFIVKNEPVRQVEKLPSNSSPVVAELRNNTPLPARARLTYWWILALQQSWTEIRGKKGRSDHVTEFDV